MSYMSVIGVMVCQILLAATVAAQSLESDPATLTEILFEEIEPGVEPYTSRLLINDQVMRLDDGNDHSDYILFYRQKHEIHSFNHEDRTHLIINPKNDQSIDFKIDFKVEQKPLNDAPKVAGKRVVEYRYFADSKLCKKSMNAPDLLPEVRQALIDYETVLVRQNMMTFSSIPSEMRSSCYMANNFLQASAYLKNGFPLRVVDDSGRQKKLMGFSEVKKPSALMQAPIDYRVYHASMPQDSQ